MGKQNKKIADPGLWRRIVREVRDQKIAGTEEGKISATKIEVVAERYKRRGGEFSTAKKFVSREKTMATKPTARYFVEKTPPNVLEWPFVVKVFPAARYVVLVRHPLAVFHSVAETFFAGDYQLARRESDVLQQYVPRIAGFIREAPVEKMTVAYERLAQSPEPEARGILEMLGLEFEPAVVEYGQVEHRGGSMGDAVTAHRRQRPDGTSVDRWAAALAVDDRRREIAGQLIDQLDPDDLATYGYAVEGLFDQLDTASSAGKAGKPRRRAFNFYLLKRRIFIMLRSGARCAPVGWILKRIRYYCDVLLRE